MDEAMIIEFSENIKYMNEEDFEELFNRMTAEKERRKKNRRHELIEAVCESMNALHKEFPYVELCVPFYCSECEYEDKFDVLEHFRGELKYSDFDYC